MDTTTGTPKRNARTFRLVMLAVFAAIIVTIAVPVIITNARHYESLVQTSEALDRVLKGMDAGVTGDFMAMDVRNALHHLGLITGQITTEDLLENIFGKFCIGK